MNDVLECVLVVDDDVIIADGWMMILQDIGLEVCGIAATAEAAIAMAQTHRPKLVLMDVRLRGKQDGVDAAMAIHDLVGSKIIFITGSREPPTLARIELAHPVAVLFKPVSDGRLRTAVLAAMQSE
jgi:DNA-binding NarL/FixJ family response regulator